MFPTSFLFSDLLSLSVYCTCSFWLCSSYIVHVLANLTTSVSSSPLPPSSRLQSMCPQDASPHPYLHGSWDQRGVLLWPHSGTRPTARRGGIHCHWRLVKMCILYGTCTWRFVKKYVYIYIHVCIAPTIYCIYKVRYWCWVHPFLLNVHIAASHIAPCQ